MLSRLLVALGSKSSGSMRSRQKDEKGEKAEKKASISLSGPLSKHAPFIVVRYLRDATDSALPLSSEVRNELNVGILEILGNLGKFEREALMKGFLSSSMEAERTLLRALWMEQDVIRYKGD